MPISSVPLPPRPSSGITISSPIKGFLPEYEEREAARFNLYNWSEWLALPRAERVESVAYHRAHLLAMIHAEERAMRRD